MNDFATFVGATIVLHVAGTAGLAGVVLGPEYILAAPALAIWGFLLLPFSVTLISIQWCLVSYGARTLRDLSMTWVATVPSSSVLMAWLGGKNEDELYRWTVGYFVGVMVGASLSLVVVARFSSTSRAA